MRRFFAIAKATAEETLDDPLSLLVALSSAALSVLAPALHYHQFGEVTRMARDAGLSSLLLGGFAFALFGCVRSLRRELESRTAALALSHAVGRGAFLSAKFLGAMLAYALFAVTLGALTLVMVRGAAIGGAVAAAKGGDVPRMHGVSLALATGAIVLAPAIAAALNRFRRSRFVLSANFLFAAFSLLAVFYSFDGALVLRYLPVIFCAALPAVFISAAALAAAVRLKANAAVSVGAVCAALFIPFIGSFYIPEALAKGGSLGWWNSLKAFASLVPWTAAALLAGTALMRDMEV